MPASKTVWTSAPVTEQGTLVLDIVGYSFHKGVGKPIRSGKFTVGGHQWICSFYPDGHDSGLYPDYAAAALALCRPVPAATVVRASYELRLINQSTGLSVPLYKGGPRVFNPNGRNKGVGLGRLIKRSVMEDSPYLQNDRLKLEYGITVIKEPLQTESRLSIGIDVPPSDIADQFGRLLETKVGVDVSFSIGSETFTMHRLVLAARSPVFEAELYGPMREAGSESIVIRDMQPDVFRAFLHFIYTDSLPPLDDLETGDREELIRHLLVAADRYAMERLKLICQSILCRNLNVQNLATTVALADQHHCDRLKDACIEFLTCSDVFDTVVATKDYKNLKRTCPSVVIDILEKKSRFRQA
ncbi:unnamed protein product [Urochloa decumbens]|uniref:Uncharacterized protein n=1 Tax=Urochloa decumbens TaxID=240449 RepID=A0ABC9BT58_9POAL